MAPTPRIAPVIAIQRPIHSRMSDAESLVSTGVTGTAATIAGTGAAVVVGACDSALAAGVSRVPGASSAGGSSVGTGVVSASTSVGDPASVATSKANEPEISWPSLADRTDHSTTYRPPSRSSPGSTASSSSDMAVIRTGMTSPSASSTRTDIPAESIAPENSSSMRVTGSVMVSPSPGRVSVRSVCASAGADHTSHISHTMARATVPMPSAGPALRRATSLWTRPRPSPVLSPRDRTLARTAGD